MILLTKAVSDEWGAVGLLLGALALLSLRHARREPTLAPRRFARSLRNAFSLKGFFAAQTSVFIAALLAMSAAHGNDRSLPLAGTALALLGLPLGKKLIFWTDKGRKQFEQALGLEMFITAAEKDRLEMLNAPDDTPLFSRSCSPTPSPWTAPQRGRTASKKSSPRRPGSPRGATAPPGARAPRTPFGEATASPAG